jgi:hypothetical protein
MPDGILAVDIPKILTSVKLRRPCDIFGIFHGRLVYLFYGHLEFYDKLVYFMAVWFILWPFGIL